MTIKSKQILTLLGVGLITALTTSPTILQTQASLTAPTSYDYFFRPIDNPSPAPDFWRLGDWNGTSSPNGTNDVRFTRTADLTYFNYTTTRNNSTGSWLPNGLEITMTFNRSNTSWTQVSGTSFYNPTDYNKIGSDASVGNVTKQILRFNNQTNKNYNLYHDGSTTANLNGAEAVNLVYTIDGNPVVTSFSSGAIYYLTSSIMNRFYIPSYSDVILSIPSSQTRYFDAWYLDDLGVSASWTAGQTDGYDDGYLDGEVAGYAEGYADGYDEGYDDGYDQGLIDGYTDGYDVGYNEGEDDGYWEGFSSGRADGYDEGYDDGLSDGYDEGYEVGLELGLEQGYGNGQDDADLLITGFTAMVGILVNFVLMIVNLEVLGVSILGIFSIVILFTGIVWVLKLIRG
jgi:hypothetical protein